MLAGAAASPRFWPGSEPLRPERRWAVGGISLGLAR